jgi:hypothetical protein
MRFSSSDSSDRRSSRDPAPGERPRSVGKGGTDAGNSRSGDSEDGRVYRFHVALRSLALLAPAVIVPLGAFYVQQVVTGSAPLHPSTDRGIGLVVLVAAVAAVAWSVPTLLTTVRLTPRGLRRDRPLRASEEIAFGQIRHIVVGGSAVEVGGDAVTVRLDRQLQGLDDLLRRLGPRLPDSVEVDDPAGDYADLLGAE